MGTSNNLSIGVDVGGSHVCSALVDTVTGEIVGEALTTDIMHTAPADEIFDAWAENLSGTIRSADALPAGIGMAFPGPFDYAEGISMMDHKFVSLKGLKVGEHLGAKLGMDIPFRFINDASSFALGEALYGAARGIDRVLVLVIGTGFGSGFVAGGEVLSSGEGVPPDGEVWNLPYKDSIADDYFSTRGIVGRYTQLTGKQVPGAKEVAQVYESDPASRKVFDEFGTGLGEFTAPLIKEFGAQCLILAGNISRNFPLFGEKLSQKLEQEGVSVEVKRSALHGLAGVTGAAALFRHA